MWQVVSGFEIGVCCLYVSLLILLTVVEKIYNSIIYLAFRTKILNK